MGRCKAQRRLRKVLSYARAVVPLEPAAVRVKRKTAGYSAWRRISSSFGLCLAWRPVRGSDWTTRLGLGWPTRSLALALTALDAEKVGGLRFVMARTSME